MCKLHRIRGARIEAQVLQLLDETTFAELERSTKQFTPATTKRELAVNPVQVQSMKMIPYRNSETLEVEGNIQSSGNNYEATIVFEDVIYEDEDQNDNITFTGSDGDEHHIMPIILNKNNVKVRCSCLDFYWRFAAFNAKDGSLYGPAPSPYTKKTNRPDANQQKIPGVCKHLLAMVIQLKQSGMVR